MNIAAIKKITTRKMVQFCAQDMRSFEAVAGNGFKLIAQHFLSMGAACGDMDVTEILPHPTTISRNVKKIKGQKLEKMLPTIQKAMELEECSATTDMWTDDRKKNHYLTMTAHYFDKEFSLKRSILFTPQFKAKKKTGINIRKELKRRFRNMGLDPQLLLKINIVTDKGSNIVKALGPPYTRDDCRNHLLNTILRNTFENDELPLIILRTITVCKKIVRYLKQSGKCNRLSKCVIQDCGTRWNYKLDMLVSVVDLYPEIRQLLPEQEREAWQIDLDIAEELIAFLTPFKEACKSMEGDTYTTANKILLWWAEISEHLDENEFVRPAVKKAVRIAKRIFNEKYTIDMTNKIACFLDPRYRHLKMLTDNDRNEVFNEVKELIQEEMDNLQQRETAPAVNCRFTCFHGELDEDILDEFQAYMDNADFSMYWDAEREEESKHLVEYFWRDNEKRYPCLCKLVRKRLNVPASSSSSERVFSDAGRTFEPRRTKLKPRKLDDLLFIRNQLSDM